jgi:hypothetical protein
MQATLVLCDFAESDPSGKVHMLGAGWSFTGPNPAPQAVVAFIQIPADRLGSPIPVTIRLLDPAHQVVEVPGPGGVQPLEISGQIEMQQPDWWDGSSDLSASFAVNFGPLPLQHAATYTWHLDVDGKETASIRFFVRPA